jgi:hypothetical protein
MSMNTGNFSKREKRLALVTVLVVLTVGAYALVLEPVSTRWKNLNNQVRAKTESLKKDSSLLADKKAIKSEHERLAKYAKSSKNADQDAADAMAYIEKVSRGASCFIVNIKPLGVTDAASCKEIVIDVTAEASMEQLSKFMYDIESARDKLINIKRFSLSSKSGQSGAVKGTFLISKTILY